MKSNARITLGILVVLVPVIICMALIARMPRADEWSLSAVAEAAQEGRIESIVVSDLGQLFITLDDGSTVTSTKDPSGTALEQFQALGVTTEQLAQIEWKNERQPSWQSIVTAAIYILPWLIVFAVLVWMLRQSNRKNKPPASGNNS